MINHLRPVKSGEPGVQTKPGSQGWVRQPSPAGQWCLCWSCCHQIQIIFIIFEIINNACYNRNRALGLWWVWSRPQSHVYRTLVWTNPSQTLGLYSLNAKQADQMKSGIALYNGHEWTIKHGPMLGLWAAERRKFQQHIRTNFGSSCSKKSDKNYSEVVISSSIIEK